jgi:hypothetical protein
LIRNRWPSFATAHWCRLLVNAAPDTNSA